MRRFLIYMAVAGLIGLAPVSPEGSDAWAQGRTRSKRSKSRYRRKAAPKVESTRREPEPAPRQEEPAAPESTSSTPPRSRGPARIDFDDRLIQGQTNKSGAVYLYDRKELKTRSMIRERENFRSEILSTVYDQP